MSPERCPNFLPLSLNPSSWKLLHDLSGLCLNVTSHLQFVLVVFDIIVTLLLYFVYCNHLFVYCLPPQLDWSMRVTEIFDKLPRFQHGLDGIGLTHLQERTLIYFSQLAYPFLIGSAVRIWAKPAQSKCPSVVPLEGWNPYCFHYLGSLYKKNCHCHLVIMRQDIKEGGVPESGRWTSGGNQTRGWPAYGLFSISTNYIFFFLSIVNLDQVFYLFAHCTRTFFMENTE